MRVNVADASCELARLVSWQRTFGTFQSWQAVEQALAVRLPDDYKRFMANFPSGTFRGLIGINNPIESEPAWVSFHWEFFDTLDRVRGWRDHEPERVPYPIFPESGGVIPWGDTNANHEFFWLPRSENPDEWSVVFSTADFERWGEYHGTMSEFVLGLVSGDFHTDLIRFSDGVAGPLFEATGVEFSADVPRRELATSPDPDYWDRSSLVRELPWEDHVRSVDIVSYLQGAGNARQIDWTEVEDRLSVVLPTDYKRFVESVGAGELSGIRIFSPTTSNRVFNLYDNISRVHDSVVRARAESRLFRLPVFPDARGLLTWGSFAGDGGEWILAWAPVGDDPDRWPVIAVPFEFGSMKVFSRSMSEVLLGYLRRESGEISMLSAPEGG
ncbi:SMI1/KNR4 family protein [Crossiella sp. SN42]|uniref:SMI1/KNR4 family protein n=1 Tax=Crossiella sp. SN42 TaxID=2944808 RepID=UPI00207C4753|nr:SMI1/KNR4 family protein [Crossiella sp. SN42]MCO1574158.1 SMI1/KNR4 family protein [Crossiella sp. SN42]